MSMLRPMVDNMSTPLRNSISYSNSFGLAIFTCQWGATMATWLQTHVLYAALYYGHITIKGCPKVYKTLPLPIVRVNDMFGRQKSVVSTIVIREGDWLAQCPGVIRVGVSFRRLCAECKRVWEICVRVPRGVFQLMCPCYEGL